MSHTYVALLEIDQFELGEFEDLPLHHCSLVLWFRTELGRTAVEQEFADVLADQQPIEIRVSGEEGFGANQDVPVWLVDDNEALIALHNRLYGRLKGGGAEFLEDHYQGEGFRAHVTKHPHGGIADGDSFVLSKLVLVEGIDPDHPESGKVVFSKVSLPSKE